MSICKNFRKLAKGEIIEKNSLILARLRCKKWSCEYCAELNSKMWRKHLLETMPKLGNKWTFITITALGEFHRSNTTYEKIVGEWDKLMKRLKRYTKNPHLEYIRILELHKSGEIHAHALIGHHDEDIHDKEKWVTRYKTINGEKKKITKYKGIGSEKFLEMLNGLSLGYQFDYTPIIEFDTLQDAPIHLVVGYVLKYMTKGDNGTIYQLPHNARKIITSRRLKLKETHITMDSIEWCLSHGLHISEVENYSRIYDITTHKNVNYDDFLETDTYPKEWFKKD